MLLDERPASAQVPRAPWRAALLRRRARPSALVLALGGCVVLAALSLLAPSAPTYDPWSWIIWGREVAHLDLNTVEGPSWKPLPVVFTTVFSLFGDAAAPDLWLVVARAGALASLVAAVLLVRRLGGGTAGGLAAAAALAIAPWSIRNAAMGNSEGLMVALVLGAIERHVAGDRRAAFLLGALAALLRPEAWPFLGLYGLWLLGTRRLSPVLVLGVGAVVVALWILPEWWGSGDALRAAHRAKDDIGAGAPTNADSPVVALLQDAWQMLTVPHIAGLAAVAGILALRRDRTLAGIAVLALAWLGLVAYMTKDGFSGNQRYLIVPVALLIVLAGVGAGRLVAWLPARWSRGAVPVGVAVVLAAAFAAPSVARVDDTVREATYQARLSDELGDVVARAGGRDVLNACGAPFTGPFLVPAVAWELHRHAVDIGYEPVAPAVVFRERTLEGSRPVPDLRGVDRRPGAQTLAVGERWRIVAACR